MGYPHPDGEPQETTKLTASVFFAFLLAACLHAAWNAMIKGSADKHKHVGRGDRSRHGGACGAVRRSSP